MNKKSETMNREDAALKAHQFFDDIWKNPHDWDFENSVFEHDKYLWQINALKDRRYSAVLEIGCGAGHFTRMLSPLADKIVALDVSPIAIEKAKAASITGSDTEFLVANIMDRDFNTDRPWDLVVMNETIYYLGWLYSFFDVSWLAGQLYSAIQENGRFMMTNTCGGVSDLLVLPWIIRTYRDLFLNVGFKLELEESFRGEKNGVLIDVLMSIFSKPRASTFTNETNR